MRPPAPRLPRSKLGKVLLTRWSIHILMYTLPGDTRQKKEPINNG